MTSISDDNTLIYASRARGKVVLITGGAAGIGRACAVTYARHGARVVIGDLDVEGALETCRLCTEVGGEASALPKKCDVTLWDDQVALFEHAMSVYGGIDIVVPNAGITDVQPFPNPVLAHSAVYGHGVPQKLNTKTVDVNITAALYTTHLALHYLKLPSRNASASKDSLKAIVLMCSMASWQGIPGSVLYSASKHAMLGTVRSLEPSCSAEGIRIVGVCPWFVDTAILPTAAKVILAGLPLAPIDRVANATLFAATDSSPNTAGGAYLIPDGGPVVRVERERLAVGIYDVLQKRLERVVGLEAAVQHYVAISRDLISLLGLKFWLFVCGLLLTYGYTAGWHRVSL